MNEGLTSYKELYTFYCTFLKMELNMIVTRLMHNLFEHLVQVVLLLGSLCRFPHVHVIPEV